MYLAIDECCSIMFCYFSNIFIFWCQTGHVTTEITRRARDLGTRITILNEPPIGRWVQRIKVLRGEIYEDSSNICFSYWVICYRFYEYVFQVCRGNNSSVVYENIIEQTTGLPSNNDSKNSLFNLITTLSAISR